MDRHQLEFYIYYEGENYITGASYLGQAMDCWEFRYAEKKEYERYHKAQEKEAGRERLKSLRETEDAVDLPRSNSPSEII
jgi:hypothetical protein